MRKLSVSSRRRRISATVATLLLVSAIPLALNGVRSSTADAVSLRHAFYLDLGASQSLGFQPIGNSRHGFPSDRAYANDLVALEAARGVALTLTELGCRGESVATMISGGDLCCHAPDSQLARALAFLRAHHREDGLVSVDLGYNDVGACIGATSGAPVCAADRVAQVRQQLTVVLHALKSAAGPGVTIIGLNHADPFLARALKGGAGVARARASLHTMDLLNQTLASVYAGAGVTLADVAGAFESARTTPTVLARFGPVARNVARACTLTWMCRPAPLAENMHPNDAGYQLMAATMAAALPAPW